MSGRASRSVKMWKALLLVLLCVLVAEAFPKDAAPNPRGTAASPKGTAATPKGTAAAARKGTSTTVPKGTASAPKGTSAARKGTAAAPKGTATGPKGNAAAAPKGTATGSKGNAAAASPKGTGSCTLKQLHQVMQVEGKVCVSVRRHPGCGPECKHIKGRAEEKIDFSCVPDVASARRWSELIKKGEKPDFSKGVKKSIAVNIPSGCRL